MQPLDFRDVQNALDALNLNIRVQEFNTSTATAQEAADSIGTELGSIVKSLMFMVNGEPIIALVSGDMKADQRKLADFFGVGKKKVKIAKYDECVELAGYEPGGVPPLGHRTPVPVYIDEKLSRFATVYAAGGSPHHIFPIAYAKLVEITGGKVIDMAG
ncbi:MAG: YbaK/EbsC family protein [Chloroflexi bacterium]|nr:YbaK/EbsC family protein [Chloroflexota bacterium]